MTSGYHPDAPHQSCEYRQHLGSGLLHATDLEVAIRVLRDMTSYLEANPHANLEIVRTAYDAPYPDLRETGRVTLRAWIEWPRKHMTDAQQPGPQADPRDDD